MLILLGTKNPSKKRSLELAFQELQINDYEIISYDVLSDVSSKPIGYGIVRGALNRNHALKDIAYKNNIK